MTSGTRGAKTGSPVTVRGITWLRIAEGRIMEGWDAWNQGRLMTQLQAAASNVDARAV
jgi:hypothetical protein